MSVNVRNLYYLLQLRMEPLHTRTTYGDMHPHSTIKTNKMVRDQSDKFVISYHLISSVKFDGYLVSSLLLINEAHMQSVEEI